MNKVFLIGRLTKDNELRVTNSGKPILKNSVAIKRDKDNTDFINFTCFNGTAEILSKYTAKGSQVYLEGELRTGSYEKDGKKIYTQDVMVSRIELIESKKTNTNVPEHKEEEQNFSYFDNNEIQLNDDMLPF